MNFILSPTKLKTYCKCVRSFHQRYRPMAACGGGSFFHYHLFFIKKEIYFSQRIQAPINTCECVYFTPCLIIPRKLHRCGHDFEVCKTLFYLTRSFELTFSLENGKSKILQCARIPETFDDPIFIESRSHILALFRFKRKTLKRV